MAYLEKIAILLIAISVCGVISLFFIWAGKQDSFGAELTNVMAIMALSFALPNRFRDFK